MTRRTHNYNGFLSGIGVKSGLEAAILAILVVVAGLAVAYAALLLASAPPKPGEPELSSVTVPKPASRPTQAPAPAARAVEDTASQSRIAFESGRTAEAGGDMIRAYEAYRQAATGLEPPDADTLEPYIERMRALARTARATGRLEDADNTLKRAIEEIGQMAGGGADPAPPVTASLTGERANIALMQRDYIAAARHAQAAIQLARPATAPGSPGNAQAIAVTIAALDTLAEAQQASGNLADAIAAAERALSLAKSQFGPLSPPVGLRLERLAGLFEDFGQPLEGLALRGQALAIAETDPRIDRDELTINLNNLAEAYRRSDQLALAEPLYKKAILIAEKTHGVGAAETAIPLNNLGLLAQWSGKQQEAEEYYMKALGIIWEAMGPDHDVTKKVLANAVRLLESQGRTGDVSTLKSQYGSGS